jgi:arginine deiminase
MEEVNFLDELLLEAEQKEELQTQAYFDLIIIEVARLEDKIASTFEQAKIEVAIINDWALRRNQKESERIELLKSKLETWLRSLNQKTIDLPHGTLKLRKKPDKVEVEDLDKFLASATHDIVTFVPEQIKPNLTSIKAVIKKSGRIPAGVKLIEGTNEFSLTIKSTEVLK